MAFCVRFLHPRSRRCRTEGRTIPDPKGSGHRRPCPDVRPACRGWRPSSHNEPRMHRSEKATGNIIVKHHGKRFIRTEDVAMHRQPFVEVRAHAVATGSAFGRSATEWPDERGCPIDLHSSTVSKRRERSSRGLTPGARDLRVSKALQVIVAVVSAVLLPLQAALADERSAAAARRVARQRRLAPRGARSHREPRCRPPEPRQRHADARALVLTLTVWPLPATIRAERVLGADKPPERGAATPAGGRGRRTCPLPPRAPRLRSSRPVRSRQLVRAGPPHAGHEPGARHLGRCVRPRRSGPRVPAPDAVGGTALASVAGGMGDGGYPAAARPRRARDPAEVLRHRAVLTLPDGTPFSEVIETYSGEVLAFPAPVP